MSALLLYSPRCKHSLEILDFINNNPKIRSLVVTHNVTERGIPPQFSNQIKVVPVMLTKNSKMLVGKEIKAWLGSLLPNQVEHHSFESTCGFTTIDGSDDDGGLFNLDMYGQSLQPVMTPELESKIKTDVKDAYSSVKR